MSRSMFRIAAVAAVVSSVWTAVPVHAAKPAKPAAPVISMVKKVSTKGSFSSFRVMIDQAEIAAGTRPVVHVTSRSGRSCTIKLPATSCVLTKIRKNEWMSVRARAKNQTVFGAWTGWVQIGTSSGYVRPGYDITGVKFPAATLSTTLTWKSLGTTSKWTKFQALKRSNVSSATVRRVPRVVSCGPGSSPYFGPATTTTTSSTLVVPTAGEPCVVFQVSGIVGLAVATSSSSCGSNATCAVAVAGNGSTSSLFVSGSDTPTVRDFYSAPNGKMYVVFMSPTRIVFSGPTCVLVEVDVDTGLPTCIDKELMSIQTTIGSTYGMMSNGNPPVQFDAAGNVYYMGSGSSSSGFYSLVLREYSNGSVRNIVNDNVTVTDFVVLPDGTVMISGYTTSTRAYWIRRVASNGQITNLATGVQSTFLRMFADGNVYYGTGASGTSGAKVYRYLTEKNEVDALPWLTSRYGPTPELQPATNDISLICPQTAPTVSAFCSSVGSYVTNIFNIGTTRTIGIAGSPGPGAGTQLVQYYPTVELGNSVISNISIAYRVKDKILLTGTNASSKNVLTMYDPETKKEEIILDGSNEVEIYSVAYVPASNKIMFNGLQFSDGKYVVSEVALP